VVFQFSHVLKVHFAQCFQGSYEIIRSKNG